MEILRKNGRASPCFPKFIKKRFKKVRWDMKSDVSVNADVDNPKRLNQNLLEYLKRNASLNKHEDL